MAHFQPKSTAWSNSGELDTAIERFPASACRDGCHRKAQRQDHRLAVTSTGTISLFPGAEGLNPIVAWVLGPRPVFDDFMFGPDWQEGCPRCSYNMDHVGSALVHLAQRDVTFAAISRAPFAKIEAFRKRMGWRFNWVSSYESDFNYDFHVSFTKDEMAKGEVYYNFDMTEFGSEEAPGISVFYKDTTGEIFHTYSGYARGLDILIGTYNYLDFVPKGVMKTV